MSGLKVHLSVRWLLITVFLPLVASADVLVEDAYVRGLPPGQPTTAAFMRLVNNGDEEVIIDGASTQSAERAEFHAHRHDNGMMRMERVQTIVIPAHEEFVLEPGGHHLMLINLFKSLRDGDEVMISLHTSNNEVIEARMPVRSVLNEQPRH